MLPLRAADAPLRYVVCADADCCLSMPFHLLILFDAFAAFASALQRLLYADADAAATPPRRHAAVDISPLFSLRLFLPPMPPFDASYVR